MVKPSDFDGEILSGKERGCTSSQIAEFINQKYNLTRSDRLIPKQITDRLNYIRKKALKEYYEGSSNLYIVQQSELERLMGNGDSAMAPATTQYDVAHSQVSTPPAVVSPAEEIKAELEQEEAQDMSEEDMGGSECVSEYSESQLAQLGLLFKNIVNPDKNGNRTITYMFRIFPSYSFQVCDIGEDFIKVKYTTHPPTEEAWNRVEMQPLSMGFSQIAFVCTIRTPVPIDPTKLVKYLLDREEKVCEEVDKCGFLVLKFPIRQRLDATTLKALEVKATIAPKRQKRPRFIFSTE